MIRRFLAWYYSGIVELVAQAADHIAQRCPYCHGDGSSGGCFPCPPCNGTGRRPTR